MSLRIVPPKLLKSDSVASRWAKVVPRERFELSSVPCGPQMECPPLFAISASSALLPVFPGCHRSVITSCDWMPGGYG